MNPNAAGIDCGSDTHHVAVPPDRDATPVRAFQAFTADLHRLADWLTACGVTSVAMESTGGQLAACDVAIEAHVLTLAAQAPAPRGSLPAARARKKPRNNEPRFEIRTPLHHLTGVDLTQIDAIGPDSALRLLAEIGTDMPRWPTEKHFTSWLTLAPHNKISGGRLLSSKTQPSANRAATILRMAAMNLGRTETALGAFYRRLAYRVGKARAITATARKLAMLIYRTLKDGLVYQDPGAAAYDAQHCLRVLRRLRQRAANLGFSLLNRETGKLLEGAVS
ncbi:MAG: transposase [Candidatus Rokubacteria bacterium]|nr:transposase [Candidatus Rokubacteria bacterium]